jgi:hypothetical protein
MMSWADHTVSNFEEFVSRLTDLLPAATGDDRLYWFRGQSSKTWSLDPSFLRSSGGLGLSSKDAVGLEHEALREFQSKAHLFVSPHLLEKVKTIPCWWALMQHHGAPTRLLDWTVSPYVAAYFAAQQDGSNEPGAVWCFCSDKLRKTVEKQYGKFPHFETPNAPSWYRQKLKALADKRIVVPLTFDFASSERLVAQQGRFTMCFKIHQRHDCIIQQIGPNYIRRLIIPPEQKPQFLLRLRDMNITAASLYPGVDGLGQSVKELVGLGIYYKTLPQVRSGHKPLSS